MPFAEVLLQTVEDSLRVESRVRPVKAGASTVTVGSTSVGGATVAPPPPKRRRVDRVMSACRSCSTVGLPTALVLFSFVYFFIGLYIRDA